MAMYPLTGQAGERRGQSGPLGFLLVFALVVAATTLIVALRGQSAALVALGDSDVQRVDLSTGRENSYRPRIASMGLIKVVG